jgi:hypothetical protein
MKGTIIFIASVLCLLVVSCEKDDESLGFQESCTSSGQCPDGWVCPDPNGSGNGTIGDICTPVCDSDSDCTGELGRLDVFCYSAGFCAQECSSSSECPGVLPHCRGSHESCAGILSPPHWCATEDMTCY